MTAEADWYTDRGRVAFFTGQDETAGDISDYIMDAAYKWVTVQLASKKIDANNASTKVELMLDPNLTMAMTWYACFLITNTIKANQNPVRILADGRITSQSYGQGDTSIGYSPADPSEHYDELTTGDFSMLAQRAMRDFFKNMVDGFDQPLRTNMSVSNAFRNEYNPDYANRLYQRGVRFY